MWSVLQKEREKEEGGKEGKKEGYIRERRWERGKGKEGKNGKGNSKGKGKGRSASLTHKIHLGSINVQTEQWLCTVVGY